ncbi:MAG: exonuclease SbcCD subunit D [Treponema sp.]|nr:exonuclease SbcCD subunit D [Treponema sp.]MCL2251288.1 exonuclease SbcCD subunit D [Treponema sp.]
MKFIHLSDLHIGKVVNGFSMLDEQRNVFNQVLKYIKKEKPTAVLIAGDIYDRVIPGVEAIRLFDDFLTELSCENVTVMIIAGNHDSPDRINYASRLLSEKNIILYGAFNGDMQKCVLKDEYGKVNFWLLPFIKPFSVREYFKNNEIESYDDALNIILKNSDIDYSSRNVLVSHQFFTKDGVTLFRSESELNSVGGLDAINAELIEKFDYAALGHLHGEQSVGSEHIRYAGSPIKYSFSEWQQKKSITLIELNKKNDLKITSLPLKPIHDMREIKGKIDNLMSDEVSSLGNKKDYLRVILTDELEIIDPIGKLRSVYPNVMCIDFDNSRKNIDAGTIYADSEDIKKLSPYDLFCEFFLKSQGSVMTEEQIKITRELLEQEEAV